ncbi:MAG: ABC-type transport auxiliary lipoprotein family protein [Candidatus Accumulibacter sp.]|jgi:cholesterol transport system auxiliary component|nr:ABC-type transport auxiliary lipoprotein family protein [Accumulibacter sp.]
MKTSTALALLLFVFLAGGCTGVARDGTPVAVYDFGQTVSSAEDAGTVGTDGWIGRLALDVRAAPWLDTPGIGYRLAYGDPRRRGQYSGSRWAASPARLLAQQLRRRIGFASADGVAVDCVLRVELQEFSQVFTAPQVSHGVAQGQASLIDGRRRLLASRAFDVERLAHRSDAAGGVQALVEASEELGRQLATWLDRLEREDSSKIAGCGSGIRDQGSGIRDQGSEAR